MTNDQIDHFETLAPASDAKREHYEKTILRKDGKTLAELRQLPVMPQAELDASLDRLSRLTATMGGRDERDARIAKLEADVAKFEKQVQGYDTLLAIVLTDLGDLSQRYKNVKLERDMLAKRIQELLADDEPGTYDASGAVANAIEAHQKQGVR